MTIKDITFCIARGILKIAANVYYSSIIIENEEFVPEDGIPTFICCNHPNSLTGNNQKFYLSSLSRKKRKHVRITCKDTLFKMNFLYWAFNTMLNSVPIMRRREYGDKIDNTEAFANLIKSLEKGDSVILFPEGYSRYNSTAGNFLMGVSNITSEVLTRNRSNSDFKINILPLSINYAHREKFRSNMIITCHRPIVLNPIDNEDLIIDKNNIKDSQRQAPFKPAKSLTLAMDKIIRNGILDSPNWEYIEYAHTARNLYCSYGLDITFGNYIRLTKRFLDVFARQEKQIEKEKKINYEKEKDLNVDRYVFEDNGKEDKITKLGPLDFNKVEKSIDIDQLNKSLKEYQDILDKIKIKDAKLISKESLGKSISIIIVETLLLFIYLLFLIPYCIIWLPILIIGKKYERKAMTSGDLEDNFDEIAQKKILSGLVVVLCWYSIFIFITLFTLNITYFLGVVIGYPLIMVLGVIILENYSRSQRNIMYNIRLIKLKYFQNDSYIKYLRIRDEIKFLYIVDLYNNIQILSRAMNLPSDSEVLKSNKNTLYSEESNIFYKIYIKLLRKEDWNDTLRTRDIIRYSKE
ncbi:hypothetical protein BCR36DRAFT_410828 [Piromyces finnis]|uniref:Phospholipid/glycerol acyltransferase domain-containing protein n=1 Tax=Piromyces finnis TaxID=1754191 RepID=A0A1Y1VEL8_9FUNG|nr:hypothetical protein BCR36DRAFT_410828 [Piromyces finnis]|eukprot:ORX54286.1 hypothetical protein BCR36DRAFT_410828 [Piromyces finnis]